MFFIGFGNDVAVVSGLYQFVYMTEYAFMGMVLLMARALSDELVASVVIKQELKKSEEKHRTILENIEDAYFELDLAGNLIFFNDSTCRIIGYEKDELYGAHYSKFMDEETARKVYQTFNKVYKTGISTKVLDWKVIRKDQSECYLETAVTLIKNNQGKPVGFRSIARDITEKRALQTQLHHAQKMKAIGTLAGGIAHDFNNILMGILGRTSLMEHNLDIGDKNSLHLKEIEEFVNSASDLTKQLLGFARGGKYEVQPTEINAIIKKSSDLFSRTNKEIAVQTSLSTDIWTVEVDQAQIEQVLLNLYLNASHAMMGKGILCLETKNVSLTESFVMPYNLPPGSYVQVSVIDTGIGISEAAHQRIFEPFYTTKEKQKGTGLGLASAYGIIKNHHGIINVNSRPGEGATFNIYLPASEKKIEKKEIHAEKFIKGSETILLVDDEEMILEVNGDLLKALGYNVITAIDSLEALQIYSDQKDSIPLVILDMIMPGISGSELYKQLKEINPEIKVLLSSGYFTPEQEGKLLDNGFHGFIQKPFNLNQLSMKIRDILDS